MQFKAFKRFVRISLGFRTLFCFLYSKFFLQVDLLFSIVTSCISNSLLVSIGFNLP